MNTSAENRLATISTNTASHEVAKHACRILFPSARLATRAGARRLRRGHRARPTAEAARRGERGARRPPRAGVGAWRIVAGRTVLLDNKTAAAASAYEVVTPLKLKDSMHVLSTAAGSERSRISELRTRAGRDGAHRGHRARPSVPHALELEKEHAR